ncbi:MAG: hypothetical protein QM786_06805 [Breznakibacter sp.]
MATLPHNIANKSDKTYNRALPRNNRCHKTIMVLMLGLMWLAAFSATAQRTYPVYVVPTLTPPYSPRLSDYCSPGSPRLMVAVTANDLNISDLPVKLHIKLESVGVEVETPPTLRTPPIYLQGGATQLLWGDDLADYFNPDNLVFKGYSKEAYTKSGQLPEGLYKFTVEVLHYHTNRAISNSGSAMAWVAVGKPPVLLSPADGAQTGQYPGMPLTFSWQASHVGIPSAAGQVSYQFEMWEMRVPGIAPATVAASMPVFYAEATQNTLLNIYPAQLSLEPGMAYAWRVTARDMAGNVAFEQDGRSQVRTFTYKALCDTAIGLTGTVKGRNAEFCWEPATGHTSFLVELRRPDTGWSTQGEAYDARAAFYDLEPGARYELRVKGVCNADPGNTGDFTPWAAVTVPVPQPTVDTLGCPTCGCEDAGPLPGITNFELRDDLAPGDTITSQSGTTRFIIKTAELDGTGAYRGVFLYWAEIWGAKVLCNYWDLQVNTDNVAVNIGFESVYDPQFLADADALANYIDRLADATALLSTNTAIRDTVEVALPFDYLYVDANGNVVAVKAGPDGLPADTVVVGTASQLGKTLVAGPDGQEYVVANNGQVMGVKEYKATGGNARLVDCYNDEKEANQLSSAPPVDFTASAGQKYGFDAYTDTKTTIQSQYPALANGYRPSYKSVASFATDRVAVSNATGITFKDEMGMPAVAAGGDLTVRGAAGGSTVGLYAYKAVNDTTEEIVGKLNIMSFDEQPRQVYIVPVNGATLPGAAALQHTLNTIYAQAVTRWAVDQGEPLTVTFPGGVMSHGGSSGIAAYNDDQRLVINTYAGLLGGRLDNDALYLFFIDNVAGRAGVAGFMPLQRQCGFIYGSPDLNIVAHELGHGAFNLYHTFSPENYIAKEQTTDNLMDYKGGMELWKYQWEQVQDPQRVWLSWTQEESEGEALLNNFKWINGDNGIFVDGELESKVEDLSKLLNSINARSGDYILRYETSDKSSLTNNNWTWNNISDGKESIIEKIKSNNTFTFSSSKSRSIYGWYETSEPTGRFTSLLVYVFKDNVQLENYKVSSLDSLAKNNRIRVGYYDGVGLDLNSHKYGIVAFFDEKEELQMLIQIDDTNEKIEESMEKWIEYLFSINMNNKKTLEDKTIILPLIPANAFETQAPGECYKACVAIMKNYDANYEEQSNMWALATTGANDGFYIHKECYEKAIKALDDLLEKGIPVIVGINYLDVGGNFDSVTNHWVIINGRGSDPKGVYYTYYEVAQTKELGISTDRNRFHFTSGGYLEGINPTVNSKKYKPIVTVIRCEPNDCACDRNNFKNETHKEECGGYYNHTSNPNGSLIKFR